MPRFMTTLFFILALLNAPMAHAAHSTVAKAEEAQVQLLSAVDAVGYNKTIDLALNVTLQAGWKTYWRTAGVAGLPLSITWDGSTNLKEAKLHWPAPHRFTSAGLESFGYKDAVTFPITATIDQAGKPLALRAQIEMMACKELCVPFNFTLALDLPTGLATASREAPIIAAAQATVPNSGNENFNIAGISIEKNSVIISVNAEPPLTAPDLIIESSSGYQFTPPTLIEGSPATLTADLVGKLHEDKPLEAESLTLTLTDNGRALELPINPIAITAQAPAAATEATEPEFPDTSTVQHLGSAIVAALIGGMILNLMPCVLPVLSLKLLTIISHGGSPLKHVRYSFLASAAGIIASFVALALVAIGFKNAGHAIGWGIQFQHPYFIIPMMVLLTFFSASLWNLMHIPLPRFVLDAVNDRLPQKGEPDRTLLGNFFTGAFATLLATPCSAPFVGTAIGFALAGSASDIIIVAIAMGLGLSAPYFLVAAFPNLANSLPKPGRWMQVLRGLLGVSLFITALWLGQVLIPQLGVEKASYVGGALFLALFIIWIRAAISRPMLILHGVLVMIVTLATVAVLGQVWQAKPQIQERSIAWQPFDHSKIDPLVQSGKVVFVDVTAEWCITCHANRRFVLEHEPTTSLLTQADTVAMLADWTKPDPAISAYLKTYGRYGIPFNIVYGPSAPQGIALPEVLTPARVKEAIDQAR